MSGTTAFWYASRATGLVALLLLTAVLVLGILVNRQGRLPGLPRFAVTNLHRNISLLAVAFITVHVTLALLVPQSLLAMITGGPPCPGPVPRTGAKRAIFGYLPHDSSQHS